MIVGDLSTMILGFTISAYWCCVGAMVVRVSRRGGRARHIFIPMQRRERLMWVVWVPLIAAWIAMPFVAPAQNSAKHPWIGLPTFACSNPVLVTLRMTAAGIAVVCLLLSMQCWRHMGRDWRMGVDPSNCRRLIMDGPFARVRHPIYALSVALMLCSAVVVPTPVMLGMAVLHIGLMYLKVCNEEEFLLKTHGQSYIEYRARTGRFLPRIRASH